MIDVGQRASLLFTVTAADTAIAVGSGSLPVLGTPRLIAWLEAATCTIAEATLDSTTTTVGARVDVAHRAPTATGETITAEAEVVAVDGRLVTFAVRATNHDAAIIAEGTITRAVVDSARFMARLAAAGRTAHDATA